MVINLFGRATVGSVKNRCSQIKGCPRGIQRTTKCETRSLAEEEGREEKDDGRGRGKADRRSNSQERGKGSRPSNEEDNAKDEDDSRPLGCSQSLFARIWWEFPLVFHGYQPVVSATPHCQYTWKGCLALVRFSFRDDHNILTSVGIRWCTEIKMGN